MKATSNAQTNNDRASKGKGRTPVQRDVKEVMAELVAKLSQKLEVGPGKAREAEGGQEGVRGPNRERLTEVWIWETSGATSAFWALTGRN
jgi:hypothetical protein